MQRESGQRLVASQNHNVFPVEREITVLREDKERVK
jgi:hypothetical protein